MSGPSAVLLAVLLSAPWEDQFQRLDQENWTTQHGGLRLADEPPPAGARIRDGILVLNDSLRGERLTSRRMFLYGTLEARVRIRARGMQYLGFMSRAPWGSDAVMCMSAPGASGWDFILTREKKGGHTGGGVSVPDNEWRVLKIVWQEDRVAFYADGGLKQEITDRRRIPRRPLPIILDVLANNPMEIDWIRVSGTRALGTVDASSPAAPPGDDSVVLKSQQWRVAVDPASGIVRSVEHRKPAPLRWTPNGAAGVDLYIRTWDGGSPTRFHGRGCTFHGNESFEATMAPVEGDYRDAVEARVGLRLDADQLGITARLTAKQAITHPVEIGLGLPFEPQSWRRQVFPRLPWLALDPRQAGLVRLPFLADPNDATLPSNTGNWIYYPFGLLEREDRTILWGGMDLAKRTVLSPGSYGSVPAVTLTPKQWAKGKTLELSLVLRGFTEDMTGILRWYLSNCRSSDPLTADLFPVRDWTPRVFPQGGGVGMPDIRITRLNPKSDPKLMDRAAKHFRDFSLENLWLGTWHAMNGSYPVRGEWLTPLGLPVKAEAWKQEIARLKKLGLRPCLYTYQFIIPEVCSDGGHPSRTWVAHGADGSLSAFDRYTVGEARAGVEWFTPELAEKVGTKTLTWAFADYGRKEVREWLVAQLKAAIDYYEPSGICFDYGWAVLDPSSVYSPANPSTSQAHGRLRVQADIWNWLRKAHPEMVVIINDAPGSPSQLLANCLLVENSDVMSDLDFAAGKAMGSAMSSMDYFADHDRRRWTRLVMRDLARGCSLGLPFWILINGQDNYILGWKDFHAFSSRATRLPILPSGNPLGSGPDEHEIASTVWRDGKELMAAAFDTRVAGPTKERMLRLKLPGSLPPSVPWGVTRLDDSNSALPSSDWKATADSGRTLILSGPLGPGQLILLESRSGRRAEVGSKSNLGRRPL